LSCLRKTQPGGAKLQGRRRILKNDRRLDFGGGPFRTREGMATVRGDPKERTF